MSKLSQQSNITENDAPFNGASDLRTSEFTSYTEVGSGPGPINTDQVNADQIAARMDGNVRDSIRYFS